MKSKTLNGKIKHEKKGNESMKKIARKIVAFLAAAIMVMAMAIPSFAEEGTGTIKVTNATVGESYSIYKLFDATVSASGDIAYTVPAGKTLTEDNAWFQVTAGNVKARDGIDVTTEDFKTWAKSFGEKVGDTVEATEETVTFTNVPYGYYFIESTLGGTLTVTSTNPNAEVIGKNQGPTWDEEPGDGESGNGKVITNSDVKTAENKTDRTKSTANYGDVVSYSIGVNATSYIGAKKVVNYFIKDTLEAGLAYQKDTLKVYVNGEELSSDKYTTEWNENNQGFEITVPWEDQTAATSVIKVTYDAIVTEDAVIAGEGNKNTANFTYQTADPSTPDNPDPTPDLKKGYETSNEKTTTTYTYALGIHKIDGKTHDSLSGAKFSIANVKAVKISDGVYKYSTDANAVSEFETDNSGILIIKGVKAGTYNVSETKAPDGYNKLENAVPVTANISETSSYTTTTTTYYDKDGNVISEETEDGDTVTTTYSVNVVGVEVINNAGTALPSTGGIGTTVFYVLGSILVLGAAIILIVRRRMNAR